MPRRDWKKELKDKAEEDNAKILSIINGENKTPFDECTSFNRKVCEFKCKCGYTDERSCDLIINRYGFICSICILFNKKITIQNTWKREENRKEYIKRLGKKLNYETKEDWEKITQKEFKENNGIGLLSHYYSGSIIKFLEENVSGYSRPLSQIEIIKELIMRDEVTNVIVIDNNNNEINFDDCKKLDREWRIKWEDKDDFEYPPKKISSALVHDQNGKRRGFISQKKSNGFYRSILKEMYPNYEILTKEDIKRHKQKVKMKCPKGHTSVKPLNSWLGNNGGCWDCGIVKRSDTKRKTHTEFMKEFNEKRGNDKIKILTQYQNCKEHVMCYCEICECEWPATPDHLLNDKTGCPDCARVRIIEASRYNTDDVIKIIKDNLPSSQFKIPENFKYVDGKTPFELIHIKWGKFKCLLRQVYRSNPCRKYKCSKGEMNIMVILEKLELKYIFDSSIKGLYRIIGRIDFQLTKYKIWIEFDGWPCHFAWKKKDKSSPWDIKIKDYMGRQKQDVKKNIYAINNKILLLRIPYTENSKDKIEKHIKYNIDKYKTGFRGVLEINKELYNNNRLKYDKLKILSRFFNNCK